MMNSRRRPLRLSGAAALVVTAIAALAACGGGGGGTQLPLIIAPPSGNAPPPPATNPPPADPLAKARMPDYPDVVGEYVQIEGGAQPTDTNVLQTPKEFNAATFLRVRSALDGETPRAANAVMVVMPGFSSTPGHWMYLAAQLVQKANERKNGCVNGTTPVDCRLEVWIVQRRGAHLADTLGARNAIVDKNPSAAVSYYFGKSVMGSDGRTTLDGQGKFPVASPKALAGAADAAWRPLLQSDLTFMADWGFETYARDVENMIALVRQESGSKNVFLAGHSQGGSFTGVYAGRLGTDGRRGYQNLAGIVMLDGGGYGTLTSPTVAQVSALKMAIDDLRSGARAVYTDAAGANSASGPAVGAREISSLRYTTEDQQAESLFPPRQAGMLTATAFPGTAAATGNDFLGAIRLTQLARAGMGFDTSPTTAPTTPPAPLAVNLQDSLIVSLGESLGLLDFKPVPGTETDCDILPSGKCVPRTSQIDPSKVYGWIEAGGGSSIPASTKVGVGKASQFLRGYSWTTNRTNIQPVTYNFRTSGQRTVDAREIVTANWYPSERYEAEMSFVGAGPTFVFDYKGLKIDVDKSVVDVPLYYAHQGAASAVAPSVFPLVSDYTNIGSTGTVQSAQASSKSRVDPAVSSQYYKHTDFVSADDSLSGQAGAPLPGQPGVSLVANTLVDWVFARTGSKLAAVPAPKDLGVVNAR
jgi:pimeloyl-ACP methyl ester carboxylesterase